MIFLLLILIKDLRKILFCSLIIFLTLSFIVSFHSKNPYQKMFVQTFYQMYEKVNISDSKLIIENKKDKIVPNKYYIFSKEHHGHYVVAARMFLENPFFGQGPRSFRYLCSEERFLKNDGICTTHPHNTYLQLLSETGILGFFLILMLFTIVCVNYCKIFFYNYKNNFVPNNSYLTIISAFIVYLFPISTNGNFFNNWLNCIFSLYFIFYLFFSKEFKRKYKII